MKIHVNQALLRKLRQPPENSARSGAMAAFARGFCIDIDATDRDMPTPRFIDDYLSYLLARASYAVYKEFDAEVKKAGLSSLEWRVLATLQGAETLSIGELAREVLAQQPTLTKLIQRMSKSGLVERLADADDARKTVVAATPAGRKVVAGLLVHAKAHEQALLGEFKGEEVQALKKILHVLISRYDREHEG
jgi:DNA-binding MarR family transcriptional regulator